MWFKARIPRYAFITWLALKHGIKTLSKLNVWGVVNSNICVYCWQCNESENHILYDCVIAKNV